MFKRLVVLCLFLTGCTTIQQDAAEMAAREPASCAEPRESEPNPALRALAWDLTKKNLAIGACPDLDQIAPNAWRIFGQFAEPSPERLSLSETLARLMQGTGTKIRKISTDDLRRRYPAQAEVLAQRSVREFFIVSYAQGNTLLGVGTGPQPVACREIK